MRRAFRATLAAVGLIIAASAAAFTNAGPATADTQICEQYGSTTVSQYIVMNNRWGTSAQQCINVTGSGFSIATQQGVGSTSGAPVSYPAIYYGCHYTKCSPGTVLPKQLSSITSATSSIGYNFVSGATYDAAYDIWLDPAPRTDGVNQQEVMIWFNRQGSIQPIGSPVGNVTLAGHNWQVWTGNNGSNAVVSYVAQPVPISGMSFNVLDFINDTKTRTSVSNAWYLTSIQAGFEPWIGGAGLAVTSFSATVNQGPVPNPTTAPTTPPTTRPTTAPTTAPGGGATACRVTYATNVWSTGFTANVTVVNTGGSAINGWSLGFTLPAGQSITSSWNATLAGSSGALTARNLAYNGTIPAAGSTSFGFQGTYNGTFAAPTGFTLNGSACSTA